MVPEQTYKVSENLVEIKVWQVGHASSLTPLLLLRHIVLYTCIYSSATSSCTIKYYHCNDLTCTCFPSTSCTCSLYDCCKLQQNLCSFLFLYLYKVCFLIFKIVITFHLCCTYLPGTYLNHPRITFTFNVCTLYSAFWSSEMRQTWE